MEESWRAACEPASQSVAHLGEGSDAQLAWLASVDPQDETSFAPEPRGVNQLDLEFGPRGVVLDRDPEPCRGPSHDQSQFLAPIPSQPTN